MSYGCILHITYSILDMIRNNYLRYIPEKFLRYGCIYSSREVESGTHTRQKKGQKHYSQHLRAQILNIPHRDIWLRSHITAVSLSSSAALMKISRFAASLKTLNALIFSMRVTSSIFFQHIHALGDREFM